MIYLKARLFRRTRFELPCVTARVISLLCIQSTYLNDIFKLRHMPQEATRSALKDQHRASSSQYGPLIALPWIARVFIFQVIKAISPRNIFKLEAMPCWLSSTKYQERNAALSNFIALALALADYRVTPPIKIPKRQNTAIATHRRRRNAHECYATAKQVLRNHA